MKCPLYETAIIMSNGGKRGSGSECDEGECVWWQKELQNCIIYQLGMEIGVIASLLEEIRDKLPNVRHNY